MHRGPSATMAERNSLLFECTGDFRVHRTSWAGLFIQDITRSSSFHPKRSSKRNQSSDRIYAHSVVRRRIVTLVEHPLPGELGTIVLKYLEDLKAQRRADQTISNHRRLLSYFLEGLRRKGISQLADLTESAIIEFVDHAHTCKREHFYSIRQFCRFLSKEGFVDRDLGYALQSNNFPNHEKLPSVYTAEEILKIENTIERSSQVGKRDYAIFIIASRLGLRVSDIAALKWSQIDWDYDLLLQLGARPRPGWSSVRKSAPASSAATLM